MGTIDSAAVSREVVKAALTHNAMTVILSAIIHPGSEPSQADINITERIRSVRPD